MSLLSDGLTPTQAAQVLGVTPNRVRQLMREERLSYIWTPLGRLIDRRSVEQLQIEREEQRRLRPVQRMSDLT